MNDTTTKILLVIVAIGIWANVIDRRAVSDVQPLADKLAKLEKSSAEITELLEKTHGRLEEIQNQVDEVASGSCSNSFLCRH